MELLSGLIILVLVGISIFYNEKLEIIFVGLLMKDFVALPIANLISNNQAQKDGWSLVLALLFTFIFWVITRFVYRNFPKLSIILHFIGAFVSSAVIFGDSQTQIKIWNISKFPMFNNIFSYALIVGYWCLVVFIRYQKFSELGDE